MEMQGVSEFQIQVIDKIQVRFENQPQRIVKDSKPLIIFVNQRCTKMTKSIISVQNDQLDEKIIVVDNLYGKYDKATLVYNDLLDFFQFPLLKWEVYMKDVPKGDDIIRTKIKEYFKGLE